VYGNALMQLVGLGELHTLQGDTSCDTEADDVYFLAAPTEVLLHSDQGSPYTSTGYLSRLRALGIVVSMSRTGD
jgi:transposase InsO family protein